MYTAFYRYTAERRFNKLLTSLQAQLKAEKVIYDR